MRAPRFTIEMPFFYRQSGERAWREGKTENISRSGVLFRADQLMDPQTPISMRFALPAEIYGQPAALVACRGHVVRAIPPMDVEAPPTLAATITRYRIVRRRESTGEA